MRCRALALAVLVLVISLVVPSAEATTEVRNRGVVARIEGDRVELGNELIGRTWRASDSFATDGVVDRRTGATWTSSSDFEIELTGGAVLRSPDFVVDEVVAEETDGGARVRFTLSVDTLPGLRIERTIEGFDGIAGLRTSMVLHAAAPLALRGGVIDGIDAHPGAETTTHALRAGADWREPEWPGPPITVGDAHPGTWRETVAGSGLRSGQWVSSADADGQRVFAVLERNDQPSSIVGVTDEARLVAGVDHARDVVVLGPFEEQVHAENPAPGTPAGRSRVVRPGTPYAFEPVFLGVGLDADDEAWQFHEWLTGHRLTPYPKAFVFNSNGTDSDRISTGAKDDLDLATIEHIAPRLRALGVETFVLDDGWQASSGDWYPDSPEHREPRGTPPRFPDATFAAVREAIEPMRLGLWMSPMHFHPSSQTYRTHPEWACAPTGHGLALYNAADPESGSNEAGIGQWSVTAIPHVEGRIREAITAWHVEYFKFDFLAWLDCADADLYEYRAAFVGMLDRLQADHPGVTFQIDETNDYRLFPFESVTRGPSWFQNGTPSPSRLLHNIWDLSPYIPAFSLGQHVLGGRQWEEHPVSTLMAAGLLSHLTVFSDVDELPEDVIAAAAPWAAFHAAHADLLDGVVFPLLDDPLEGGWTAFQAWDAETGRGVVLGFRQGDDRPRIDVALHAVPDGTYDVYVAPTGEHVGRVSAEELRSGLRLSAEADQAHVLVIVRSS